MLRYLSHHGPDTLWAVLPPGRRHFPGCRVLLLRRGPRGWAGVRVL